MTKTEPAPRIEWEAIPHGWRVTIHREPKPSTELDIAGFYYPQSWELALAAFLGVPLLLGTKPMHWILILFVLGGEFSQPSVTPIQFDDWTACMDAGRDSVAVWNNLYHPISGVRTADFACEPSASPKK